MINKKFLIAILLLFFSIAIVAEEDIKVESFALSTTTNYANTKGHIVYDENGEKCALIIVDTRYPELLTFDGGSLGIKKVIPKTGQVWVYVPEGLKRITISGENLGTLREYDLGVSVRKARTYILKLTTKDVETIVFNDSIQSLMRIRVISEKDNLPVLDANISINGIKETLNQNGVLEKHLSGATYRFRVESELYKTASGTFVVDGTNTEIIIKLQPNYEIATIKTPSGSEIWIDGQMKGQSEWIGPLLHGEHLVICKLDRHYDYKQFVTVTEESPVNISIGKLEEIQGTINITSSPTEAEVLIDNKRVGTTPFKSPLMIGTHIIEVKRTGYSSVTETVSIQENIEHHMSAALKREHRVDIISFPSDAKVILDKKEIGTTPIGIEMRPGYHYINIETKGYYPLKKKVYVSDNQKELEFMLRKKRYKSLEWYAGVGYCIMPSNSVQIVWGAYFKNFQNEFIYSRGLTNSDIIYWYNPNINERPKTATYSNSVYNIRVGYGFVLNNTFRITPQLGFAHLVLSESVDSDEKYANGAYASSLTTGIKMDIALYRWCALSITPYYSIPVKKSGGYQTLENLSNQIKGFSSGFGLQVNLSFRYIKDLD